ncbi:MAG: hypothetical protein RLZ92_1396 [Pseudomonadota bacterium]
MIKNLVAGLLGLLFGFGLIIANMTNPSKVLAFLDVSGEWDPSLAIVMASALLTLAAIQRLMDLSPETQTSCDGVKQGIDRKLLIGSTIFGIGWGLSGICPGPALLGISSGLPASYVFLGAMFVGFVIFNRFHQR